MKNVDKSLMCMCIICAAVWLVVFLMIGYLCLNLTKQKVTTQTPVEKEYEWSTNTAFDGTAVSTLNPFTSFALSAVEHKLTGFPFLSVTYMRPSMSQ